MPHAVSLTSSPRPLVYTPINQPFEPPKYYHVYTIPSEKVKEERKAWDKLMFQDLYYPAMDESGRAFRWLFNDEQLRKTPSSQIGISQSQEIVFRQKQAMLMQALGQKSGLTQLAINTSVVFMHRFYMFRTVKFYPRIHVAIGFVFAAGKVEESARKLEHLIRTTIDILRHSKNGEFLDKRDKLTYEMDCEWMEKITALCQNNCNIESAGYVEMRRTVLECEAEIYAVIGFHLQIVHPHNFVIRMCALLGAETIKDISQYAYNLATASSQLTLLCLKYKPELIATVCLNIAAKAHSVKFMCMKDSAVQWYQVYDPNTDIKEIESVSEEFLGLIKSCQLLPSWMTSLARAPRSNPRSMPSSSKGVPHGHPNRPHPSSSHSSSQGRDPTKPPPPPSSSSSSSHPEHPPSSASAAGEGGPANGGHHRPVNVETSSGASDHANKDSSHSSSSGQLSGSARPHSSASGASNGANTSSSRPLPNSHPNQHHSQSQHRAHHNAGERSSSSQPQMSSSQPPSSSGSSASNRLAPNPLSRHSSSSALPPGSRPHSSSSSSHPPPPSRPRFDPNRPDGAYRSDASEARRSSSRPMPPPEDASRSSHPRLSEHPTSQRAVEPPSHNPPPKPASPPGVRPPSPVSQPPEPAASMASAGDASQLGFDEMQGQEVASTSDPNKLRSSTSSSRLTLSSYRERVRSRPAPPSTSGSVTDDSGIGNTVGSDDTLSGQDVMKESSATNSPAVSELKPSASAPELTNFNMAQDSPTNPRIKIKVKRDPNSGERHSVKYADTGLKIKIKPPRMDPAEGEPGPSSSRSATPMEEGEVVDSPNSTSSGGDRKVEGGLKIRLSVPPRSGESSGYLRGSEQQVNGHGEHRSHHHSHHHRSHHSHKSKKHSSKHSSSRHERSSKRPSSHEQEERPSKHSRLDYPSQSTSSSSGEMHRNYSESGTRYESSSRSLQHQNSGFSINDAFSSTLPTNIFDEDEDSPHIPPPITPTPDALPSHHERFHLMSKHRAQHDKPPLPPLPSDRGPPPPPPPPPSSSPPPPSSL